MSSSGNNKNIAMAAGLALGSFIAGSVAMHAWCRLSSRTETLTSSHLTDEGDEEKPVVDLEKYILDNSLREPAILRELRTYTRNNVEQPEQMIRPVEAQFYRLLLNIIDADTCIEIGAYTGYNALSCALSLSDSGIVYALEANESYLQHGYAFFEKAKVSHKIKPRIGSALESLDELIKDGHKESIDFIYIDADVLNYLNYLERALVLLRVGGIVSLNGTLQTSNEQIHKLNQTIKRDSRFQLSLLNVGNGITLCRKILNDFA